MSQHRAFTGGEAVVRANGATVGQVIDDLEANYPGIGSALRAGSSAGIGGEIHAEPEYLTVASDTEIYFLAPVVGG